MRKHDISCFRRILVLGGWECFFSEQIALCFTRRIEVERLTYVWHTSCQIKIMNDPCLLEIEFLLLPQKQREFAQSLEFLATAGKGLVRRSVYVDRDEPERVLWIEEWATRQMLEAHLETEAFKALVGGLRTLGNVLDCRVVYLASDVPDTRHVPRYLRGKVIPLG